MPLGNLLYKKHDLKCRCRYVYTNVEHFTNNGKTGKLLYHTLPKKCFLRFRLPSLNDAVTLKYCSLIILSNVSYV